VIRIDVFNSRELQAVILAVKSSPRAIRRQIRQESKRVVQPEWQKGLAERAESLVEHRLLVATATVLISDQNIKLRSATKGRPLRGGLNPKTQYYVAEYGADRSKRSSYESVSRKGKRYKVPARRTATQLRSRNSQGYVYGPTVANIIPRIASLWTQTVVRIFAESLEGKSH
jgi:hypothetical protein